VVAGSTGSARARAQVQRGPGKPMTSVPLKVSIQDDEHDKTKMRPMECSLFDHI